MYVRQSVDTRRIWAVTLKFNVDERSRSFPQELLVKARAQLSRLVEECNTALVGEKKDDKNEVKTELKTEPSENGLN